MSVMNIDPSGVKLNLQSLMDDSKKLAKHGKTLAKKQHPFRFTTESSLEGFAKYQNSDAENENARKAKMRETQSENWLG